MLVSNSRSGRVIYAAFILFVLGFSDMGQCFEPLFFDFGTEKSPVMVNFQKISPRSVYSARKGFGWLPPYPQSVDGGQHATRKNRGPKNDPDSLTSDFIESDNSVFRIDVPPGRYWVTVWMGTIGGGLYRPKCSFGIRAQGKTVWDVNIDKDNFYKDFYFKNKDWELTSKTDVFEELIRSRLPEHTFSIATQTGALRLQAFGLPLLALAVLPDLPAHHRTDIIEKVNKERRKEFYGQVYKLNWPKEDAPHFTPSPEDRRRGYVLFERDFMEPVWPHSKPSAKERSLDNLTLAVAGGDTGVLSLGLLPLTDLEDVDLRVVGKIANGKHVITTDKVRLSRVAYGIAGTRNAGLDKCRVVPWIIKPAEPHQLPSGWTIRYLLTINVPKGTPAGQYRGTLRFSTKNRSSAFVKFTVNVLSFDLSNAEDYARGFFYYPPRWYASGYYPGMEPMFWEAVERDLRLIKEYGFNTLDVRGMVKTEVDKDSVRIDFSKLNRFWALYRRVGLEGHAICSEGVVGTGKLRGQSPFGLPPSLPYNNQYEKDLLIQTIRSFRDEALASKWPGAPFSLVFWCTDELGGRAKDNVRLGMELLKIYKNVEGIRTFSTVNTLEGLALLPYLDVIGLNVGVDITQELIKKIRDTDTKLAFFNLGGSRYAFGFFIWRTQGSLYLQWNWNNPKQDPFILIDGYRTEDSYVYQTQDGIFPTYRLEEARLGVNDYRYIRTLEDIIRCSGKMVKPKPAQIAALDSGRRVLAEIQQSCGVEISKIHYKGVGRWQSEDYRKARTDIINAIMNLFQAGIPKERAHKDTAVSYKERNLF